MGRHKDPDTLSFIEWLRRKGESLGFIAKTEYALLKNEYFVDLVWKLPGYQDPLFTFEIETEDGPGVFSNTYKIFGPPSTLVSKPWKHFMIIYKTGLSEGHKNSLFNIINQHNIFLFENVFTELYQKQELEKTLENLAYDICELLKTLSRAKPFGVLLPLVQKGLTEGIGDGPIKDPEVTISFKSRTLPKGGAKITTITETPKGEPIFLDKLREASRTFKPITIEAPQLKDIIVNGKSILPKERGKAKLIVIPKPLPVRITVPGTDVVFDEILLRRVRTEGTVDYLSTEDRNLPFVFEFALDKKQKDQSFNFKFEHSHADVKQSLRFEEFIRALNLKKELRIVEPKENITILIIYLDESLEQSDVWYNLISKLSYIQEKTKHTIPAPMRITKEDVEDIYTLIRVLNTGEERGTIHDREILIKTNKQGARNLIDISKKQGKISNLELSQASTYRKIFDENIPLGPSKMKLPDMQFVLSVEEIEELIEDPEEAFIELPLKPIEDKRITIRFENWLQKKP